MTPYRHSVNYCSIPFLPTSLWLLKKPPVWELHFLSYYIDGYWQLPRTVIIWHVLTLPQRAIFLLITGREPISKNPLPSPCPFFSAEPAVWEELLQWEEAWPFGAPHLHVGLWERSSEGYTEAPEVMTRDDRKGCLQGFFEARSAWTRFGLNFFNLKSLFELRLSISLAAFIAFTNPDEKRRERNSYFTGILSWLLSTRKP